MIPKRPAYAMIHLFQGMDASGTMSAVNLWAL